MGYSDIARRREQYVDVIRPKNPNMDINAELLDAFR
jgi:hypothetical protein